ncbi:hypothetical protein QZH41_011783 [Actinostola sp. cb2023]|nr:hypothetical protein QZH41_011783 [Actinostola sp. cb2023]
MEHILATNLNFFITQSDTSKMHAILLLVLVLVPWLRMAASEQLRLPLECLKEYKKVVDKLGDEKDHCLRIQLIVNCFSKRPDESGLVLDDMRYLFTQESIFVKKLDICPDIDYDDLKTITDKTSEYIAWYPYDDHWDDCAGLVHKKCIKKYLSLLRDGKLCNDVTAWIDCYDDEAEKSGCEAMILTHFKSMLRVVGKSVVKSIRRFMGAECSKQEL